MNLQENRTEVSSKNTGSRKTNFARFLMFVKRRLKLNRFLLVIDLKKGVSVSAISVIVVDLIDLLWHLSLTFGPLNGTFSSLLFFETLLVIFLCLTLLYCLKSQAKLDLRATLFTWLVVVVIDYFVRALLVILSLFISEKASPFAKTIRIICSCFMLALVAHCWLCVFSYFDEINDKTTTVKITPSDDRTLRKSMLARVTANSGIGQMHHSPIPVSTISNQVAPSTGSSKVNQTTANMLRAPEEVTAGNRW